ncbi:MAG: hypothetical protein LUI87_13535 [Lachnospiraceae bacterium]|nr:hypothetical protein [Lachnospiraceae bacterium]
MDRIKEVQFQNIRGDKHSVIGVYTSDIPGALLRIEIWQGTELKAICATQVNPNGRFISSKTVELKRGLYQVKVYRCINNKVKPPKFAKPITYQKQVMAGEPYRVSVRVEAAHMYDRDGTKVSILADCPLENEELYYEINKADTLLQKVHFWVPMGGEEAVSFFVESAMPNEVVFPAKQNSKLKIVMER